MGREEAELVPRVLRHWLVSRALVAGLALGCYANSCWGDFVFDDSEAVLGNKDVDPGASSLADIFSHDFWGSSISSKTSHKSYRPLTVLSFRLTFWLAGGREPFHFHLINVLLHPLVCLILLEVLNNWFSQSKNGLKPVYQAPKCTSLPLVAALLFAVHPIHTESVSGVVGRAELGSALLYMLSLLAYPSSHSEDSGVLAAMPRLVLTLVLAGSAMLFKEQGVTVLGVCLVSEVVLCVKECQERVHKCIKDRIKSTLWHAAVLCVGGAGLVWARFAVMTTGAPQFKPIDNPASFSNSWITRVLSYNYIYSLNWWLLYHPWWLCFDWSMGCVPLLRSAADTRLMAVCVFWAGLVALTVWGFCQLHRRKGSSEFAAAWMNLGIVQAALNKTREAEDSYKKAILHRRKYPDAYYNMGNLYIDMGLASEAISAFSKAIALDPLHVNAWTNLGLLYEDLKMYKEAETVMREAMSLMPQKPRFHFSLGVLLGKTQRLEEGEEYLTEAVRMRPNIAKYHVNLGVIYHMQKRYKLAENCYQRALQLEPTLTSAEDNLRKLRSTLSKLTQ